MFGTFGTSAALFGDGTDRRFLRTVGQRSQIAEAIPLNTW
jgi:hypothetical protein